MRRWFIGAIMLAPVLAAAAIGALQLLRNFVAAHSAREEGVPTFRSAIWLPGPLIDLEHAHALLAMGMTRTTPDL